MKTLKDIISPVETEFAQVKEVLKGGLRSEYLELDKVAKHLVSMRGKMMRPLLTLLSAKLTGEITQKTINVAATIEYVHSATLVHDDIIDEAYTRQNQLSLSTVLRSHTAVLFGDYMFTKGLALISKAKGYRELDLVIGAIEALVEGELLQSKGVRSMNVTKESYMDVARLKTASLIATAAEVGATSSGAGQEAEQKMRTFGELVGVAFQIQDDILDYSPASKSGKTPYNDIKERKITLPLLCAMQSGGTSILKDVKTGRVKRVSDFVAEHKGVERAKEEIGKIIDQAVAIIESFEACDSERIAAKESLKTLALFAGDRIK